MTSPFHDPFASTPGQDRPWTEADDAVLDPDGTLADQILAAMRGEDQ